jgi:metallo-beta-lactamase family protein
MRIKFCGAAREVTGSAHLITLNDGFTILLDCGMYQGSNEAMLDFNEKWLFDPSQLGCLIVSHAHIDHTGRIPQLVKDGFRGTIHATHATRDICALMLQDSARIQAQDTEQKNRNRGDDEASSEALYSEEDCLQAIRQFTSVGYETKFRVHPDVEVEFRDAGHILGSASVFLAITEGEKTIRLGFTADIGRPNRPILRDPMPMPQADYLICESTYGDKDHESAPNELERFTALVHKVCVEDKGKLLIPAFSVGRTQEVVYILDQLANEGKLPRIPIYVDSPLSINATEIFRQHPECYDDTLVKYMLEDPNPFGFNSLHYVKDVEQSKTISTSAIPCIIISASGMMNSGRVKHHLANMVSKPEHTILLVGYCSPETPGGQLRNGAKDVFLYKRKYAVRASVESMDGFSAHGDRGEIYDVIKNQKEGLKRLFLVHGDYETQQKFKPYLEERGFANIEIPALGEEVELI